MTALLSPDKNKRELSDGGSVKCALQGHSTRVFCELLPIGDGYIWHVIQAASRAQGQQ
jgi:hypothetical protein